MYKKTAITKAKESLFMTDILDPYENGFVQQIHYNTSDEGKTTRYVFIVHHNNEKYILKATCCLSSESDEIEQAKKEYTIGKTLAEQCEFIAKPLDYKELEDKKAGLVYIEALFEYAGEDLSSLVGTKMTTDYFLTLARKTLEPLTFLESKGVFHSDIKPHNIVIKDGIIKLIDFGVSKNFLKHTQYVSPTKTITGKIFGFTSSFCPPEVFLKSKTYIVSGIDVYAWGMTMYQLLSGKSDEILNTEFESYKTQPGKYNSFLEIVSKTVNPAEPNNKAIRVFSQILLSVLAFNPEDRPSFAALKTIMGGSFEEKVAKIKKELTETQENLS